MTSRRFKEQDSGEGLEGRSEKAGVERWQDTSRTPKSLKTSGYQRLGVGASVDGRAARKEKASDSNASHGTVAQNGRKTAMP